MRPGTRVSSDIPRCTGRRTRSCPDRGPRRSTPDWEDLSRLDPLWAVLSDPTKRFGARDPDEFFAAVSATSPISSRCAAAMASAQRVRPRSTSAVAQGGSPARSRTRFERCVGVDISAPMVEVARELNADRPGCEFLVNDSDDLSRFDDASFDFVVSHLVLQHVPGRESILRYVGELARVLRPGGHWSSNCRARCPSSTGSS